MSSTGASVPRTVPFSLPHVNASDLPWFPAKDKRGETRYGWYAQHFGSRCWELDALNPIVLRHAVETAIEARIDVCAWERANVAEAAERESLQTILDAWPGISGQACK